MTKAILKDVRSWYMKHYPDDDLGREIPQGITFSAMWERMQEGTDIYAMLGTAADSVIRERVMAGIAEEKGLSYEAVYNVWINQTAIKHIAQLYRNGMLTYDEKERVIQSIMKAAA